MVQYRCTVDLTWP